MYNCSSHGVAKLSRKMIEFIWLFWRKSGYVLTLNLLSITQLPSVKLKHIIFLALVSKSWTRVESSVHHVAVFCVRWLQFCKIVNHVQFTFNPYRQTLGAWHRRISWKLFPDISGKSPISWPKIVKSEKVRKKFAGYPLCQRPFLEVVSGIFLNGLTVYPSCASCIGSSRKLIFIFWSFPNV